jgi:hypothetical protein
VHGLPEIGLVGQLCEACQVGKQQRTSFPAKAEYRAERCLELVHGDLCGPTSPATSRGNKYFLSLADDLGRYMWITVIPSKDHVATAIKDIKQRSHNNEVNKVGYDGLGPFFLSMHQEQGPQKKCTYRDFILEIHTVISYRKFYHVIYRASDGSHDPLLTRWRPLR